MEYTDQTVKDYGDMVRRIAWNYTNDIQVWEDLVQEGYIGLGKACDQYVEGQGAKFSTWAWQKISSQVQAYLRYRCDMIHIPHYRDTKCSMVELDDRFDQTHEHESYIDLMDALSQIDETSAKMLRMHYVEGYSKSELSREYAMSRSRVASIISEGIEALRNIMEK